MLPLYLLQLFDLSVYSLDDLPDSVFLNIGLVRSRMRPERYFYDYHQAASAKVIASPVPNCQPSLEHH
jgi:hypothetical protein